MSAVTEAASSPELHLGLLAGAIGVGAIGVFPAARRHLVTVIAGAMAVALAVAGIDSRWAVVGLVCLAGAGSVGTRGPRIALVAAGTAGLALSVTSTSTTLFLCVAIPVSALALGDVVSARGPAVTAALLGVSVVGIWASVPDTEEILLVGGVLALPLLAMMFGALDRVGAQWSRTGPFALVAPVVWAAVSGGRGRPGSAVAGVACLGLLLVDPVVCRVARSPAVARRTVGMAVGLVLGQVALVIVTSRVAATRTLVAPAALISGAALLVGGAVIAAFTIGLQRRQS